MKKKQAFHLNEDFADVLALSHKPERGFYVVSSKRSRLQWSYRTVLESTRHQIANGLPVAISWLKQRVQQDAVERYVAQKYSHACTDMEISK